MSDHLHATIVGSGSAAKANLKLSSEDGSKNDVNIILNHESARELAQWLEMAADALEHAANTPNEEISQ